MEKYDVVIIGSGLGGLQCGYILSRHGLNVCVLEKNARPGGCLQTFRRGKHIFDTGFHYVGGLDEGQPLQTLFRYFGLMNLPWRRMDEDGFDEIILNGKSCMFANGYERFADTLSERFPHQRENLKRYAAFLQNVSAHIFDSFEKKNKEDIYGTSLFAKSAYDYLTSVIDDPLLRNVLSGTSLKMELHPQILPLYTFAQINSSFIQSAWRLQGGGAQIAASLIGSVEKNGGTVRMNGEVTRLIEKNGKIVAAEINGSSAGGIRRAEYTSAKACDDAECLHGADNGVWPSDDSRKEELDAERIEADYFIADMHPASVLPLITESAVIRNIYRKRINSLKNTFGMFTANIALRENTMPYLNRNIYVYKTGENVWQYAEYKPEHVNTCALVSFRHPEDGSSYTRNIDILMPMYWPEVEQWAGTTVGHRGDDYTLFKERKINACIHLVSEFVPGLKDVLSGSNAIERIYASTPLSYRDYTGTPYGSAYGIRKNCGQLMTTLLSPRTPEPNLFLTGQNLNLHGVLGVSMTSFFTCAEITGMDTATEGLF
ncbi:MAG: NAD(P)/FAD-dependent oxidoreductase [Tannerella sp.]|jgi:all-trans-retinol 13,14-reductase|nr:NAD(P)/FAD-dependent oxidoreductase [Tannerella sp.]